MLIGALRGGSIQARLSRARGCLRVGRAAALKESVKELAQAEEASTSGSGSRPPQRATTFKARNGLDRIRNFRYLVICRDSMRPAGLLDKP